MASYASETHASETQPTTGRRKLIRHTPGVGAATLRQRQACSGAHSLHRQRRQSAHSSHEVDDSCPQLHQQMVAASALSLLSAGLLTKEQKCVSGYVRAWGLPRESSLLDFILHTRGGAHPSAPAPFHESDVGYRVHIQVHPSVFTISM